MNSAPRKADADWRTATIVLHLTYIENGSRVVQLVEQNETEAKAKGVSLSGGSNPLTATKTPKLEQL